MGFLWILGDSGLFWVSLGFSLLLLAIACFGLLWLRFLFHCCSGLCGSCGSFFACVAHFWVNFLDFLTRLKSSCIFVAIFGDLSSIFGGLGRILGRILGGFFDDFCLTFEKSDFVKIGLPPRQEHDF